MKCLFLTQIIKKMSENMYNALKENANIEINEIFFFLFPASQINARSFVECTSFKKTNGLCTFALVTVRKSTFYPFFENPRVFRYRTLIFYPRAPFEF